MLMRKATTDGRPAAPGSENSVTRVSFVNMMKRAIQLPTISKRLIVLRGGGLDNVGAINLLNNVSRGVSKIVDGVKSLIVVGLGEVGHEHVCSPIFLKKNFISGAFLIVQVGIVRLETRFRRQSSTPRDAKKKIIQLVRITPWMCHGGIVSLSSKLWHFENVVDDHLRRISTSILKTVWDDFQWV